MLLVAMRLELSRETESTQQHYLQVYIGIWRDFTDLTALSVTKVQ